MVSIIVPVYQAENSIRRCIESVLCQSNDGWELILIDDGSTDNSGIICDKYAGALPRITVEHISNSRVSHARNLGLSIAQGDIVEFLDADDQLSPNAVETVAREMQDETVELLVFGFELYYNGRLKYLKGIDRYYTGFENLASDFMMLLQDEYFNPPWDKAFKKSLINELFNERLSPGEDAIFNLQYIKNVRRIKFISTPLYKCNATYSGLTTKYNRSTIDAIGKRYGILFELMKDAGEDAEKKLKHALANEIKYFHRLMGVDHNLSSIRNEPATMNSKVGILSSRFEIEETPLILALATNSCEIIGSCGVFCMPYHIGY